MIPKCQKKACLSACRQLDIGEQPSRHLPVTRVVIPYSTGESYHFGQRVIQWRVGAEMDAWYF